MMKSKYELRRLLPEQRNVRVGIFGDVPGSPFSVFNVERKGGGGEDSFSSSSLIYMVHPADGSINLRFPDNEHLFVLCIREAQTDMQPYVECLVELPHNLTHPTFMLPVDAKQLLVCTRGNTRQQVLTEARETFQVK